MLLVVRKIDLIGSIDRERRKKAFCPLDSNKSCFDRGTRIWLRNADVSFKKASTLCARNFNLQMASFPSSKILGIPSLMDDDSCIGYSTDGHKVDSKFESMYIARPPQLKTNDSIGD